MLTSKAYTLRLRNPDDGSIHQVIDVARNLEELFAIYNEEFVVGHDLLGDCTIHSFDDDEEEDEDDEDDEGGDVDKVK